MSVIRRRQRNPFNKKTPQSEDLDRWLVSYADYMTLMFALFVVLYAMAILKEEQYQVLSQTLGNVFENQAADGTGVKGEGILVENEIVETEYELYGTSLQEEKGPELVDGDVDVSNITEERLGHPLESLAEDLDNALFDLIENGYAKVEQDGDWLTIELNAGLLFVSGSASATSAAKLVLDEIMKTIGPVDNFIRIRGYTDNQPINTEIYPSNWELSVARAASVLRVLEQLDINPARIAIEGYGQYAPFDNNSTEQGRRNNRKVVIALSKYAWHPQINAKSVQNVNKDQTKTKLTGEKSGDYDKVQIIQLPSGGLRITTRRDEQNN